MLKKGNNYKFGFLNGGNVITAKCKFKGMATIGKTEYIRTVSLEDMQPMCFRVDSIWAVRNISLNEAPDDFDDLEELGAITRG